MCCVEIKCGVAEGRFTTSADLLTCIKTTYFHVDFFLYTHPELVNMYQKSIFSLTIFLTFSFFFLSLKLGSLASGEGISPLLGV